MDNNFEPKKDEFNTQQDNMSNPYYNQQQNTMNNQYYNQQQNGYMNNQYYNPQQNYSMNNNKDNGKTSMICGISSIVLCFIGWFCCIGYLGVPLAFVGIVMGIQTKEINGGKMTSDGKIGLATGIAGLAVLALGFFVGIIIGIASVV